MNVISPWAVLPVIAAELLTLSGCGKQNVRNDKYEQPTQPDLALRQLMGVRTLRTSFEMPEDMRTYRTGLIFIENDTVVGSNAWTTGDNVHTYHSDGKKEYAKTLHVEYMNWKDGDEWKNYFRVTPSFFTQNIALLVFDFSAEEQDTHGAPLETPSNEELQNILDDLNYR